jgi:hypothetical protein
MGQKRTREVRDPDLHETFDRIYGQKRSGIQICMIHLTGYGQEVRDTASMIHGTVWAYSMRFEGQCVICHMARIDGFV